MSGENLGLSAMGERPQVDILPAADILRHVPESSDGAVVESYDRVLAYRIESGEDGEEVRHPLAVVSEETSRRVPVTSVEPEVTVSTITSRVAGEEVFAAQVSDLLPFYAIRRSIAQVRADRTARQGLEKFLGR